MTGSCPRGFDDRLLSGLVDGELTQQDEQRTTLHVAECERCRELLQELRALREVTMSTRLQEPSAGDWNEAPRTHGSRLARLVGWPLLLVWLAGVVGFALWQVATGPEAPLEKLLVFGGLSGVALLFLSVLLDRIRSARTDRYRGVQR